MNKRMIGFLMATVLLLSMCIGAHAQEAGFLGTWYLESMAMEGVTLNAADLGMSMTMTVNENGTVEMVMFGETASYTWEMKDGAVVVEMDGNAMALTLDGGKLTMTDGDGISVFGREPVVSAEGAEASPVREDVTLADFSGSWQGAYMTMPGMRMPVAEMGMEFSVVVQGSTASLNIMGFEKENLSCAMDGYSLVIDGFDPGESNEPMPFFLHEDNTLSCGTGNDVVLWFERAQE